jgi:hypothetical protein
MKFDKLLISLIILVFCTNTVYCMDPLNPSQLGETMGMPLPQELLHKAVRAGITTGASQDANEPLSLTSGITGVNLPTPLTASSALENPTYMQTSETVLDVNGNLSLILQGEVSNYLNLLLRQDDSSVLGQGNMISGNSSQNVIVSGIVEKGKLSVESDN